MSTTTTTATQLVPAGTWAADPAHSRVGFAVKHLGIATVRGTFGSFDGSLVVGDDLTGAAFNATIAAASVDTAEEQRDAHLRSADFFDVEQHPTLTFASTRVTPVDEDTFTIVGDLTMHGVTREVALEAVVQGAETDPWGNERVAFEITGQLSRGDFGMTFNQALGSGNLLVSDRVKLSLDISAVRQAA
jgi:polyisoprenoid-binding protein YceI